MRYNAAPWAPGRTDDTMRRWTTAAVAASFLVASLAAGSARADESTWEWQGVDRVVAIGDTHGTYDKLVEILQGTGLIDESLAWVGGDDHLVIVGDTVDRNPDDRPIFDLLIRLQDEASAAGGHVHVLLGNHEIMNLVRDLRYVPDGSYKYWKDDEDPKEIKQLAKRYNLMRRRARQENDFYDRFPPGYFARLESFDADGQYGKWMLDLPGVVKINEVAYVHGGIAPQFAAMGIAGINAETERLLREHLEAREILEQAKILNPFVTFPGIQGGAEFAIQNAREYSLSGEVLEAAQSILDFTAQPIFREQGPYWYRDLSWNDERMERAAFDEAMELLGTEKMVVAHTPTRNSTITARFAGRLYRLDTGVYAGGGPQALIIAGDDVRVYDVTSGTKQYATNDAPQGDRPAPSWGEASDAETERLLREATVVDRKDLGRGRTRPVLVTLQNGSVEHLAVFKGIDDPVEMDRFQHEIAAYRVDRKLGLGMVPVTIETELDGKRGSLQAWVDGAVDLESVENYNIESNDPARIERLFEHAKVFDFLIGNNDRGASDTLLLLPANEMRLVDHSRAFLTDSTFISPADDSFPEVDVELAAALRALDRAWMQTKLDGLLSQEQIDALLARRDLLLSAGRPSGGASAEAPGTP